MFLAIINDAVRVIESNISEREVAKNESVDKFL